MISVSVADATGNKKLQTHKHTFTCEKNVKPGAPKKCRFHAPFMPSKNTIILTPLKDTTEAELKTSRERYQKIQENLENNEYNDFEDFYHKNDIQSDDQYNLILRAGIRRPRYFIKRLPSEKLISAFNPFIFSILTSNMDIQLILEEYSCANYVVEYINKTNRGFSDFSRKFTEMLEKNPHLNIMDITRKMGVDMLNHVEMCTQEVAWFLLRQPMSKSSVQIIQIPTFPPEERKRMKKFKKELEGIEDDCTDVWKENLFDKYEKRPAELKNIWLADFAAKYSVNRKNNMFCEKKNEL